MTASLSPIPELFARLKSDPSGGGGILDSDGKEIFVARAPGRLDVMGGIADYTGALVCEMPLDVAAAVAVQRRDDRILRLATYNAPHGSDAAAMVELSLDDLWGTGALLPLDSVRDLFRGPRHWAAYIAGAYYVLAKHRKLNRRSSGANIACYSTVPLGGGVSSSAALEVAALSALTAAYGLILDPLETAVMAQRVENHIVGAPCGVMDQVTSMLGKPGQLLLLHCQPHTVQGYVDIPPGLMLCGLNSNVKHSVGGSAYRDTRIAAFMAHAIIAHTHQSFGAKKDPTAGYLANITPAFYRAYLRPLLPRTLSGRNFLAQYTATIDHVTTVDPAAIYHVRAAADHHILENARVHAFAQALATAATSSCRKSQAASLVRAGRLMLASHCSYGKRANLGSPETDILVRMVSQLGPQHGFYGAKITGGGSGGTVAILCTDTPDTRQRLAQLAADYQQATGLVPQLLLGSSSGAADTPIQKFTPIELFR